MRGNASSASEVPSTLGGRANSTRKKIAVKFVAVVAVSYSVFVLSAISPTASPISVVTLAAPQAPAWRCRPPSLENCYTAKTMHDYLDRVLPDIAGFFKVKYKTVPGRLFKTLLG